MTSYDFANERTHLEMLSGYVRLYHKIEALSME